MKGTIFFLLFFLLDEFSHSFRCGTDSINKKPKKISSKNLDNKRILSNTYTPIKIMIDYEFIESQDMLNSTDLDVLIEIFNEVTNSLSSLLSVIHEDVELDNEEVSEACEFYNVSSDISKVLYNYDVLIFPKMEFLDEGVLAQAWTCLTFENNRPMVGVVEINQNFTFIKYDSTYSMKYTLLHEISHILGFSYFYFKDLGMLYNETKKAETKYYLRSPKVIEKAKLHFNCENIKGIQLENQGGSGSVGSHWEARYMLGDYMMSTDYIEVVISDMTLAYFEDTGFYKANYYTGGLFRFGKNKGCKFLETECVINNGKNTLFPNEFCTEAGEFFCGSSHISRGDCYIINYKRPIDINYRHYTSRFKGGFVPPDYCPVSFPYEDYYEDLNELFYNPHNCNYGYNYREDEVGEIIGKNSVCLESSLFPEEYNEYDMLYSLCYQINCDRNLRQINVYIGNNKITCPTNGGILDNPNGIEGQLKCPDYNIICTSNIWCNELFDCIEQESLSDLDTYDFYKNNEQNLYPIKFVYFSFIYFIFNLLIL